VCSPSGSFQLASTFLQETSGSVRGYGMPQSLAKNLIHLIFSTRDRQRFLEPALRSDLHRYMAAVLRKELSPALLINSVWDHVHVLFNLHRTRALSDVVMETKRSSSKWLKTQGEQLLQFHWQAGFGAFSIGQSAVEEVLRYIRDQEAHHHRVSFQDEFREFLKRYEIEYDERYVWD
jgi:REP element-mobilizing transposase RayT